MTRFYDIDEANATILELEAIVTVLAEQRVELIRLRDHALARSPGAADPGEPLSDDELRLLRLRMQGLVDQMAADFEKENPGIKVKPVYAGTYQETIVKALTAHKSGTPPTTAIG